MALFANSILADFSSALLINPSTPVSTDVVGVLYWQVRFNVIDGE